MLLHLPPSPYPSIMHHSEALSLSLWPSGGQRSHLIIFAFFTPYPNLPCIQQNHNIYYKNEFQTQLSSTTQSIAIHQSYALRQNLLNSFDLLNSYSMVFFPSNSPTSPHLSYQVLQKRQKTLFTGCPTNSYNWDQAIAGLRNLLFIASWCLHSQLPKEQCWDVGPGVRQNSWSPRSRCLTFPIFTSTSVKWNT